MVNVGDTISEEQSLITVEGDKVQWKSQHLCWRSKRDRIAVGDKVSTGSLIMVFEVAGSAPAPSQISSGPAASAPAASAIKDVNVPDIGGDEVEVTEVMVKVGDTIEEQSLITVEGDKSFYGSSSTFPVCKKIKIAVGDKVKTGSHHDL